MPSSESGQALLPLAEEVINAVTKLTNLTGAFSFEWKKLYADPIKNRFVAQVKWRDLIRLGQPVTLTPWPNSDKYIYEAISMVNGITFIALIDQDEAEEFFAALQSVA